MKALADKPEKIYCLNDYKTNERIQGPNVYHVKTTVSDIKDEDFKKATQEMKDKKSQKNQSNPEPKNYWPWIIGGISILAVISNCWFNFLLSEREGQEKEIVF